jgi:chemotaxis protein methyltransferase CheR
VTDQKRLWQNIDLDLDFSDDDRDAIVKLSLLARELTGVQLSERHQSMIASRLYRRTSELGLESLSDYVNYFYENRIEETPKLVGLLTTHHTYFFREFSHFEFLLNQALPELIPVIRARGDKKLRIWVAACSRGQEVYSLAMYLDLHLKRFDPSIRFEILGTDIDPECVAIAKNGVYLRSELKAVPLALLGGHWVKGTGGIAAYAKAKKTLRDHCRFHSGNLLDLSLGSTPNEVFDLIFCRNVFIYFDKDQIRAISEQLLSRLAPEGFFFIGNSESLAGLNLRVGSRGPSVYRHKKYHDMHLKKRKHAPIKTPSTQSTLGAKVASSQPKASEDVAKPIRVLCVDDSPSILTLLKQILSKEHGFEVVGVAKNGLEASKQVSTLKPDVLTLDIHMPEQTGVEYLEKNLKSGHPPVVMVTSVSRENAELAGRALTLGAADYVEKPALANLAERGEEIRTKIRCALLMSAGTSAPHLSLDRSFQKASRIENPESKLRIVMLPLSARSKLKFLVKQWTGIQPATLLFVEGAKDALLSLAEALSKEVGHKISAPATLPAALNPGEITLLDFSSTVQSVLTGVAKNKKISISVFGDISKSSAEMILKFNGAHLVLEDLGFGKGAKALADFASDIVLHTSFAYLSNEFFAGGMVSASQKDRAERLP